MTKKMQIMTSAGAISILLVLFGVYGFYKAQEFLKGPSISITSPENGQETPSKMTEIIGKAVNISTLFLNGRQVFTDRDGNFKEGLLLANGYNIIAVSGTDKFGRKTEKKLELVFNK